MTYDKFPPTLLLLEALDIRQLQRHIHRQRRDNPTDAHFQLVMDRQQQRLDKRLTEFSEALSKIAAKN